MRDGRRAGVQPAKQAGWQSGWVAWRWESGGHPSLLCCAVIRRPSGSSGLFELYVPLIIHLGCSALGQAHKDLIYSLAGNEGTWRSWPESSDCWPCCQEIELMDGLQRHSTPTTTPPFPNPALPLLTPQLDFSHLGSLKSFYGCSGTAEINFCFILHACLFSYLRSFKTVAVTLHFAASCFKASQGACPNNLVMC